MLHVYIEALSWFSPYTVLKVSAPHHRPKAVSLGQLLGARKRANGGAFKGQESSGETQSAGVLLIVKHQSRLLRTSCNSLSVPPPSKAFKSRTK